MHFLEKQIPDSQVGLSLEFILWNNYRKRWQHEPAGKFRQNTGPYGVQIAIVLVMIVQFLQDETHKD